MLQATRTIQEHECKWRIASTDDYVRFMEQARQLGADVSEPRSVAIHDVYLDTEDGYFHLAGARCRLRSMDDRWELTFKASRKADNNIFRRMEKTFALPGVGSESEAMEYCQREILLPIVKGRSVVSLFSLSNRREIRELVFADGIRVESGFDEVEMRYLNRSVAGRELELELLSGNEEDFSDLVTQLTHLVSLQPNDKSKYDQALEVFGLAAEAYGNRAYQFDGDSSIEEAARAIVRRDLQMIRDSEPGVRVGIYHDAIHDMRVACRRVRTALRIFKAQLPERAHKTAEEVAWLGRVLGRGRDLEVQIATLKNTAWLLADQDRTNLHPYWERLSDRFQGERREIMQALDSPRYTQLLLVLENIALSIPEEGDQNRHTGRAGARIIGQVIKGIFAKYPRRTVPQEMTDRSLHKLRIEMKRIRYLCEFFSHVSSAGIDSYIQKTKVLQKILGDHQDLVTGNEMVRAEGRQAADPALRDSLAKLATKLREGKVTQQRLFRDVWRNF
jgi:CHAD domain-containing protein|tara:strand:+ start:9970 stop:11481 length:1512 start_codon:yes stop_codon:yes gene_type:complete